jgi:hypothetical protein
MSKMAELDMYAYDIEQMYINGWSAYKIADVLDIPESYVHAWMEMNGVEEQQDPAVSEAVFDRMVEELSPFETVNS